MNRLVALGCPGGHELELPAKARAGVYGPCPCGWSLALQGPAGVTLGQLAAALGYSREAVRKMARKGMVRTTRAPFAGSHRRVPPEEVKRLLRDLKAN